MKHAGGEGERKDGGQIDGEKEGNGRKDVNGGKRKLPKRLPPDLENQWEELRKTLRKPLEAVVGNVHSTLRDLSSVGSAVLGGGMSRTMMRRNGMVGAKAPRPVMGIP